MKIYLIDDDKSIVKMLQEIIVDGHLGEVIGQQTDSLKALEEIKLLKPDILIADMLMPQLDGASLTQQCLAVLPELKCIMISQVSSKKIVGEAYENGIHFYITKPVNKKEVTKVIQIVGDQIKLERSLSQIKHLVGADINGPMKEIPLLEKNSNDDFFIKKSKIIFSKLGILGESGCDELIQLCLIVKGSKGQAKLKDISCKISDNPKATEQRIRRAINKGMTNLACLGIEDYLNDTFVKYSNTLFDFEQVMMEMEYRRGKKRYGGKINIMKFVDNLILCVDETI